MDLSNKTLALFLLLAVAVSIVGTIFSLNKLGGLTHTGLATGTGRAELNISTTTSVTFRISTVNWSTGSVNATSYFNCTLATNSQKSSGCLGFNTVNESLVVENDGNSILTLVQIKSSVDNTSFPGGTYVYGGPQFKWNFSNNETNSCNSVLGNLTWIDVNTSSPGTLICSYLDFLDANDTMRVGVYVSFPYTTTGGTKTATLTVTGT